MIDGGPLRTSRPAGRQTAYRGEPVRYQPEEPVQAERVVPVEPPRQVQQHRQSEPEPQKAVRPMRSFGWMKWVVIVVAVIAILAAGWMVWQRKDGSVVATIDTNAYQAVFLSNGQVYFGKLAVVNRDFMKLTNIYYLERQLTTSTDTNDADNDEDINTPQTNGDNSFQLLKYSDVLYGSEDAMIISKDDIVRYENLRSDGVVARAIANRR